MNDVYLGKIKGGRERKEGKKIKIDSISQIFLSCKNNHGNCIIVAL